jgi:hypothetical protein
MDSRKEGRRSKGINFVRKEVLRKRILRRS